MSYAKYVHRIENLKYQIRRECTGNAEKFAEKLGISRRTLFRYLETLRDEGFVFKYDRYRKTYFLDN